MWKKRERDMMEKDYEKTLAGAHEINARIRRIEKTLGVRY